MGANCLLCSKRIRRVRKQFYPILAHRQAQQAEETVPLQLLEHVLAYALIPLYRQAAAALLELATAEISNWRQRR